MIETQAAPAAAPATDAPRMTRIPPPGAPGHEAAEAAYAKMVEAQGGESVAHDAEAGADPQAADTGNADAELQAANQGFALADTLHKHADIAMDSGQAAFYGKALTRAMQNPPNEAQKQAAYDSTLATLRDTYPESKVQQLIADARAEVKALAAGAIPNIEELLDKSGGTNDLHVLLQLAQRGAERARKRIAEGVRRR